jgi:hypothetical protein
MLKAAQDAELARIKAIEEAEIAAKAKAAYEAELARIKAQEEEIAAKLRAQ